MRKVLVERKAIQRLAQRALGVNTRFERIWRSNVQVGSEAELLALPFDPDAYVAIQNAAGALYFVSGISRVGGDDIIA